MLARKQLFTSNEYVGLFDTFVETIFSKMEMAGLGTGDYSFTSDARGTGSYTATVSGAELGKWKVLKVAHHPDRNPRNMKNIGSALEGNLKQAKKNAGIR